MIFISHSESDARSAELLREFIIESMEVSGDRVILSRRGADEDSASEWMRMKSDLEACSAVVALIPSDDASARGVLLELGAAWALDRLIFLIFMPGVSILDMPSLLSNYQSADAANDDAHITMMDVVRETADFLGVKMSKRGDTLGALERFLESVRGIEEDDESEDDFGFNTPCTTTRVGGEEDEYCNVVCTFEVASLGGGLSVGHEVVRATWADVFKSFARNLNTPQDDEMIKKLLLEFCKSANAKFGQNCQYGMYKKPGIEPYAYQRIIQHFAGLGYVVTARAPHSAFGNKKETRTYWMITERGEDFLASVMHRRKSLQEWFGGERHVRRGAILDPDRDKDRR